MQLTRNKLTHSVFWPGKGDSTFALVNPDGEVLPEVFFNAPFRGSDIAKLVPDGFEILTDNAVVLSMSGKVLIGEPTDFDTVVVTQRAEVSLEDRLAQLERKDRNRDKDLRKLKREKRKLEEELGALEPVVEVDPAVGEQPASEPSQDPVTEVTGGDADAK